MNAKEKARELIETMYNADYLNISVYSAKQCAIIAVDEIINSSPSLPILGDSGAFGEDIKLSKEYWLQVKKEINEL